MPSHSHRCLYAARLLHRYYSGTYLRAFWSSEFLYYFYPVTLVMWMLGKVGSEEASEQSLHWLCAFDSVSICYSLS